MTQLTIHLLGQFQVLLNGKAITHFATDKVRALLAYLAIENQYPHRREKLAALFWPEKSESTARTNLRRALADLRANIQDQTADPPFLRITRNDIQLNLDGQIEIDCLLVDEFINHGCDNPQDAEQCDHLLELYQGDFLEGFSLGNCISFEEWLVTVREQFRRKVILLLQQVIRFHQERNHFEQALPYCRQWVVLSPWEEEPRRQLMKLLALAGHREEALQQYDKLRGTLAEELGVEPEPLTEQLMENIRNSELIQSHPVDESVTIQSVHGYLFTDFTQYGKQVKEFVGRRNCLAHLQEKLTRILNEKTGNFHFITGEAGSGKSWLIQEFVKQAQDIHPPLVIASGYCNAYTGKGDPFLPFREIFSQLCGDFESQYRSGRITREYALRLWYTTPTVFQSINTYGRELIGALIPEYLLLEDIVEKQFAKVEWYQALADFAHWKRSIPSASIQTPVLFSQVTTVLQKISHHHPLIIVIDDLHWADIGTLNLLMHLGKHLAGYPILLLCAFRSEEVFLSQHDQNQPLIRILNEMQREYGDIFTRLDEIPGRHFIQEFLDSEPNAYKPDFAEYLFEITGGLALSVSELMATMRENGSLVKDGERRWIESGERVFEEVPPKIEGILAARIQKLPHQVQQYLTLASIQGDIFNAEIIAEISGQKKKKVIQLLNGASTHDHHLIQRQHQSLEETERFTAYTFRHILFQKYLYDSINLVDRKYKHEQVAYILEALTEDNPEIYAAQLARHFQEAGRLEKAIQYYIQAAKRAQRMVGYQEATSLFETALDLLLQLPESPERDQQELLLQKDLCYTYQTALGIGHEKVKKANDRAWELCQITKANEIQLEVLEILSTHHAGIADYERWAEIEARKKEIRSQIDVVPQKELIRQCLSDGWIDWRFGRFQSCTKNARLALKVLKKIRDSANPELIKEIEAGCLFLDYTANIEIDCISLNAYASCVLGEFHQVVRSRDEIARITATLNDKNSIVYGTVTLTRINRWLKEFGRCEPLLDQVRQIAGEEFYRSPSYDLFGKWIKGFIHLYRQEYDQAIEAFSLMTQRALKINAHSAMNLNYQAMAEAYQKKGDTAKAKQWLDKALAQQKKTSETLHLSLLARLQGNILRLEGKFNETEEKYLEAIQIAQQQSAKTFELYAVEELCQLWHQQGKTEQAHQRLSEMLQEFDGQPNVGILREAKALLQTFQVEPNIQ